MSTYDFKQLSPHDFEQLARDLLQARDGIVLESFKSGRDLGIDFRHASSTDNIVVQCKHYVGTGLRGLMSDLRNEAVKVEKIQPTRYILATSVGLTPLNKNEIQSIFGSVLATADILGPDDLTICSACIPMSNLGTTSCGWRAASCSIVSSTTRPLHRVSSMLNASIATYGAMSAAQHIRARFICSIRAMWQSSREPPVSARLRSQRCCSMPI
jgi:hypothetical protein